jgi:hypothetical protein
MPDMTHPEGVDDYVARVRHVLESSYAVQDQSLAGRRVLVGHRRDFKLRWFASRLYTTVCVVQFAADVDTATLDSFLEAAGREARVAARGTPGLQSGSAVVAVAVLPRLSETARDWAARPHGHEFASIAYPVAVGVGDRQVVEPQQMRIGRLFKAFLREVTQQVVAGPLLERGSGGRAGSA